MKDEGNEAVFLFDEQYPCWTAEMFELAEVERASMEPLLSEGWLSLENGVYFLSPEGREHFKQQAEESWLPLKPGSPGADIQRTAFACELKMLVDKRHAQRWGLKEYISPLRVSLPDINKEDLFSLEGGRLTWRYPDAPAFRKMREDFPNVGVEARNLPRLSLEEIDAWLSANAGEMREVEFDLLYKSRYDFQEYTGFAPLSGDRWGLFNTDRFLFRAPPETFKEDLSYYLNCIGEFHMFLEMQRRLYMPGLTDRDALQQDSVNWLLFAFGKESEAEACAELLRGFGSDLAGCAKPLEIWSVSFERLKSYSEGVLENIWDLLPFAANSVYRLA